MPLAVLKEKAKDLAEGRAARPVRYADGLDGGDWSRAEERQAAYDAIMSMTRPLPADFDEKEERRDAMAEKYGFVS